jgi:hypothetical protein
MIDRACSCVKATNLLKFVDAPAAFWPKPCERVARYVAWSYAMFFWVMMLSLK